jgi:hypothetical protein
MFPIVKTARPDPGLTPGALERFGIQRDQRLEILLCTSAAAVLILFRSAVFVLFEQNFDSDQAIVGLMAKHVSEFRAFPLFFYGQNYMLGVQAWIAAPFFWIGGPTVAMLRLPLVLINIMVSVALIVAFARRGVRPILGFVATLPVIATPPIMSGQLLAALGASIEPLLYVLMLWVLRNRPLTFGALLCFGTLHREFTIFAMPAILVVQWLEYREIRWPAIAKAAGAFAVVWIVIDLLKLHVNTLGALDPSRGHRTEDSLAQEAVLISQWLSFQLGPYLGRFRDLVTRGLPDVFGARPHPLLSYGLPSALDEGSRLGGGALAAAAIFCAVRLFWTERGSEGHRPASSRLFCPYLAMVASQTIVAYGLNGGIDIGAPPILRYVLFALFLPVALFGAYFQSESRAVWQWTVCVLIVIWAGANVSDNARLIREFVMTPPPNDHRILADFLTSHRIKYGWATYWDCYRVDFLARERVILASTDITRIGAYQTRVDRNRLNAVMVRRLPCDEGKRVAAWCVSDPFNR